MKTNLKNKYVIGVHVMFYEVEIYKYYIDGLINLLSTIDNKDNITLDFCFNISQNLEKIDLNKISKEQLVSKFHDGINKLLAIGMKDMKIRIVDDPEFYSQTDYRRELNYFYCRKVDYIIWGETDSLIPKEGIQAIEALSEYAKSQNIYRYIMCFADRKMWDESWNPTVHSDYENILFVDDDKQCDNLNYSKSSLSLEKMNEINSKVQDFDFRYINYPKIDGSFLVISCDLIKSGVNIPPCFVHNDDETFGLMAKLICGEKFIQFICKNLLKVHARRHPEKRMYVLNENNKRGFCGKEKGDIWLKYVKLSKENISTILNSQNRFYDIKDLNI